ncbi:MAG: ABC transporter permease, partial [Gemmatimonadetes bacterium]|nr:ABC transporter permease [Gemmatimonadota bacterium]
ATRWYWSQALGIIFRYSKYSRPTPLGQEPPTRGRRAPTFVHDVRYAFRSLRRGPGFTSLVVLTLGLGIGANTAIFSLVNTLVFRPLPFRAPDQLVRMRDAVARPGAEPWLYNTSARSFVIMHEQATVLDGIVAQRHRVVNITGRGDPLRITGIGVSADWASVLGVAPVMGRAFSPEEDRLGRDARVVVIGHGLWQRLFGAHPSAVGQSLNLDGLPYVIIGVMPPRFNYPYGAELWIPGTFELVDPSFGPQVTARVRDGLLLTTVQEELNELSRRVAETYPETHGSVTFTAVPLRDDLVDNHPRLGWILLGAVSFLLLISCANVASLLLVRSLRRRKEFATRAVLGASRGRLVRQLAAESVLLTTLATGLGVVLTFTFTDALALLSVSATSSLGGFFQDVRVDGRVLTFSLVVGLVTALLFGLMPTVRASQIDLHDALRAGGRSITRAGQRAIDALVVAEVALALILLNGAGLMVQSFDALQQRTLGYEPANRLVLSVALPPYKYSDIRDRIQFVERVIERVEAVPGVVSAGVTQHLPLSLGSETQRFSVEGGPASEPGSQLLTNLRIVSPDYHTAMAIPLVRGRLFSDDEGRGRAPPVVIVNEPMATRFWGDADPIGKRVKFGDLESRSAWRTIIGVVGDVDERFEVAETWYLPYGHAPVGDFELVVQTASDPTALSDPIRAAVWEIDPDLPVDDVRPMMQLVNDSRSEDRLGTYLMGALAVFAVFITGLGIYAVISFAVAQQTHDIGVRVALGSGRPQILRLILLRGAALLGLGVLVGVPGAVLLTRVVSSVLASGSANVPIELSMISEVSYLHPTTYAWIASLLAIITLAACLAPARRATRLDPMQVLRHE